MSVPHDFVSTFDFARQKAAVRVASVPPAPTEEGPSGTEPLYSLTPQGQYVLDLKGAVQGPLLDEVAVCFDRTSGALHKHGGPASVELWFNTSRRRLTSAGYAETAAALVLAQGKFPLVELNRMLRVEGYVKSFFVAQGVKLG